MTLFRFCVFIVAAFTISGCSSFKYSDESKLEAAIKDYKHLNAKKAFAVTMAPEGWAYGFGYDHATQALADERALIECEQQRVEHKLKKACSLYMQGNTKIYEQNNQY